MKDNNKVETNQCEDLIRKEIENDLTSNIFVEAGAGAGKTSILVRRIMNQIKSGKWNVDQIVAITFTNKAAQELKDRIGKKLLEELHKAEITDAEKSLLENALHNLNLMQISTIHSFCFRLLTETSFAAGMRMDMRMLENNEEDDSKKAFFKNWYNHVPYRAKAEFLNMYLGNRPYKALENTFLQICDLDSSFVIEYPDKLFFKNEIEVDAFCGDSRAAFERILVKQINAASRKNFKTFKELVRAGVLNPKFTKAIMAGISDKQFVKRFIIKVEDELIDANKLHIFRNKAKNIVFSSRHSALGDNKAQLDEYHNALVLRFLTDCLKECRKLYKNYSITNDLLLQKTRDMLKGNAHIRKAFAKKFRCIYIDEFQDTDPVQTELLFLLCKDQKDNFRKGSLFIVGDPKQSIYRFRGADLHLYYRTKTLAEEKGFKVYGLNYNFRSNAQIVSFVNQNNARLMDHYQNDGCTGYEDMVSKVEPDLTQKPENCLSGVYHLGNPCEKDSTRKYIKDDDIDTLVNIITRLVDDQFTIWDKDEKKYRPIAYRDFLVLCYSKYSMEEYMDALIQHSVPVQLSGLSHICGIAEIQRLFTLYNYLAYPRDKRATEAARQVVMRQIITQNNVMEADERLKILAEDTYQLDGAGCLYYLARHLEYLLEPGKPYDKNSIIRLQAQIQQMMESVLATTPNNRQAIAQALEECIAREKESELSLHENADAVRFMNVHKSKGLEGRIVIVCKRSENREFRHSSYQEKRSDGKYHFYASVAEPVSQYASNYFTAYANNKDILDQAKTEETDENYRLDYVEVTRAMEALIILNSIGWQEVGLKQYDFSKAKELSDFLDPFADETEENNDDEDVHNDNVAIYDTTRWNPAVTAEQKEKQYWRLSPSQLEMNIETGTALEDEIENAGAALTGRPTGNLFGTAMHRCFELMIQKLQDNNTDKTIQECCVVQAVSEIMDDLAEIYGTGTENVATWYAIHLKTLVANFAESEIIKTLLDSDAVLYTEYPFSLYISRKNNPDAFTALEAILPEKKCQNIFPSDEGQVVWVNGKADLVAVYPDSTVRIIDYKSDARGDLTETDFMEIIHDRYDGQMELYRQMLSITFDTDVNKVRGDKLLKVKRLETNFFDS